MLPPQIFVSVLFDCRALLRALISATVFFSTSRSTRMIDRIWTCAVCGQDHQAAHDRDILQKIDHILLLLCALHRPEVMEIECDWYQVEKQNPGCNLGLKADENREPTS